MGRFPDGSTDVYAMNVATIGKSNIMSSYMTKVEQTVLTSVEKPTIAAANGLRIVYGNKQLIMKSEDDGPVNITVFSANGIMVEQTTLSAKGGKARLDVSQLEPGFYVAQATNNNGTRVSCKFMK